MSGANAAGGLPGYQKTFTQPFSPAQYDAAAPAPPDAGLPSALGNFGSALDDMPPNTAPPTPDRCIIDKTQCPKCGTTVFPTTDAAACPNCREMMQAVTPTYTPGTPWF